jgi:hypothetical protein
LHQRRRGWKLRALLAGSALAAAVVLFLSLVPTMRYVPSCGSWLSTRIEGPLRERYLFLMTGVFDSEDVFYVRRGDNIYLRYFSFFDGNELFDRYHVLLNFQPKMASAIAEGVTIDDVFFPPPARLMELIRATEDEHGPYPKRTEEGERIYGPDQRFKDCELMRAAIIDDDPY